MLKKADELVESQSVPPTPKNLSPTTPNLDIVQKALDIVQKQCKQLKDNLQDLQQQYNSVNEELKSLKSNVDNGKENSTSDTDDDVFNDENEDLPAHKVNRNSSCDLNPCCLTYPLNTLQRIKREMQKQKAANEEKQAQR
jgi:hypothetical protein